MDMQWFLKEVASGKTGFRTSSNAIDDLATFQQLAEVALQAEALGYVGAVETRKESFTGHRFYRVVFIRRGITDIGREAIAKFSARF
jgi:hypothetical protein